MVVMNAGCSGRIKTLFVATCHLKNNNNNKVLQDLMNSATDEVRKVAPSARIVHRPMLRVKEISKRREATDLQALLRTIKRS